MANVTQMNGKPFLFFTFTDFSQDGRRAQLGKHTSIETASRAYWRQLRPIYEGLHGHRVWLEDALGARIEFLPKQALRKP